MVNLRWQDEAFNTLEGDDLNTFNAIYRQNWKVFRSALKAAVDFYAAAPTRENLRLANGMMSKARQILDRANRNAFFSLADVEHHKIHSNQSV